MTQEIKALIELTWRAQQQNIKSVLATVVALKGSSYRRPGVRMLIQENGKTFGAVSGGCVEREVQKQANSVLETNIPKMITYDGRFRLGCEGVIYILIEPIKITLDLKATFDDVVNERKFFECETFYSKIEGANKAYGSQFIFSETRFLLRENFTVSKTKDSFKQSFSPAFQLYLFGAEHDAVHLCKAAANLGWHVIVVAPPDESKTKNYFEGAHEFITPTFETLDVSLIDKQTAVMLMTHSFNKDIQYLLALANTSPAYFGILGPKERKESLLEKVLDFNPEISIEFIEQIHGPAGINIGAESAEEISVSILAEILTVIRNQKPFHLKEKIGRIHD